MNRHLLQSNMAELKRHSQELIKKFELRKKNKRSAATASKRRH
jgi:hypothetical protein